MFVSVLPAEASTCLCLFFLFRLFVPLTPVLTFLCPPPGLSGRQGEERGGGRGDEEGAAPAAPASAADSISEEEEEATAGDRGRQTGPTRF